MKVSRFEWSLFGGIMVGWIQLMFGHTAHAFYSLGVLIVIILMAIMEYIKIK